MLNSNDIISLTTTPRTGLHRGKVLFHRDRLQTPQSTEEAAQRALLDHLVAAPAEGSMQSYPHPGDAATPTLPPQLSAADLAWLQRLPAEPHHIPYEDGRVLAGMAQATPLGSSDRRLVDSIWNPVKNLHDIGQAKAALANTDAAAVPTPPPATHEVLAATLARELPMLTRDEVNARARVQLQDAVTKQSEARRKARDAATQTLADATAGRAR